jgi:hypothetical protein
VWSIGVFHLSPTVQMIFDCIDLAQYLAFGDEKLGVSYDFRSATVISYQRHSLKRHTFAGTVSFAPTSVQISISVGSLVAYKKI